MPSLGEKVNGKSLLSHQKVTRINLSESGVWTEILNDDHIWLYEQKSTDKTQLFDPQKTISAALC